MDQLIVSKVKGVNLLHTERDRNDFIYLMVLVLQAIYFWVQSHQHVSIKHKQLFSAKI